MCFSRNGGGLIDPKSLLIGIAHRAPVGETLLLASANVAILISIWYVVSKLSTIVREHEKSIIDAEERLRRLQHERDKYAVQMTHQLKAPLDAVRSSLMLIIQGYVDPVSDSIKERLEEMDSRARGLGSLIMNVLKLYQLQMESSQVIPFETADLEELLGKAISGLGPLARERKITLQVESESIEVECVPDRIEMLIHNIVSNAIMYSHPGGKVKVTCRRDPKSKKPLLTVTDHGIGIHPDKISKIFVEYYHTEEAFKHNTNSTGIGLAIVKKIAERHNLNIVVDSTLKKGSTFRIFFP